MFKIHVFRLFLTRVIKEVSSVNEDTSVFLCCYYALVLLIFEYCSLVWVICVLQLLERQVLSVAMLFPVQILFRRIIFVTLLDCVCCTRLIRLEQLYFAW